MEFNIGADGRVQLTVGAAWKMLSEALRDNLEGDRRTYAMCALVIVRQVTDDLHTIAEAAAQYDSQL